jgi:hypothetical protein
MFNIPKSEQEAARERTLAKAKAKREKMKEETEQIDEIAPLVAGGLALGGAIAGASAIKRAQDAAKSGVDAANKGQKVKPGTGIGNAAYGMQRRNNALNNAMKQLRQSYEPDGEFVEEDKEYRREMAKAAARERAEEKKSDTEWRKTKPGEKKKVKLSTTPHTGAEAKNYADKEVGSIKLYDKATKKNKNPIGLVTKEEVEIEEGMTMKDFKQQRSRQKQKDKRESEKTSPLRRAGIHDDKASPERASRHRANVDPDYDHDDEEQMYPGGKLKNPKKIRKAKAVGELTKEEYIEEKALSRAQQRFMGMVYAAKKGGTPASPEVAKAAEGMSKKAARDFAKTKHEGLPEKKVETKEEVSLVQKIISEFSPLSEGKLDDLLADIRGEDDGEKKSKSSSKKSEKERKEEAKKQVKRGKSDPSALTRRAAVAGAARLKAEQEKTKRQRERQQYERERRAEKSAQKRSEKEEKSKEKQSKLEASMKEKRIKAAQTQSDKEEGRKQQTKKEIKSAVKQGLGSIKTGYTSDKESASKAADQALSNVGSVAGGILKAGKGIVAAKMKERNEKKQEQKRAERHEKIRQEMSKEEFSNWREEFIFEVDDQSVQNEKQKVIDVSKKKNKIEINPNMSEGCGCDEKEKEETPKKDMRDLPTKVNLLKTKARAMGARNPIVMVASEETDNIQEIAPLLAAVARVAAPAVTRGVTSRLAGSAAQGTLRAKAAQLIGQKAGEKMQNMFTTPPASNQSTPSGEEEPLFQTKLEKQLKTEGAAWTKKEGKSEAGGLNEKGRKSYERENPGSDLKAPSKKVGNPRRASFCSRMSGMKAKLTSKKTANDPDSRINKSLRAWNC